MKLENLNNTFLMSYLFQKVSSKVKKVIVCTKSLHFLKDFIYLFLERGNREGEKGEKR